jgi:hypothetical protein
VRTFSGEPAVIGGILYWKILKYCDDTGNQSTQFAVISWTVRKKENEANSEYIYPINNSAISYCFSAHFPELSNVNWLHGHLDEYLAKSEKFCKDCLTVLCDLLLRHLIV